MLDEEIEDLVEAERRERHTALLALDADLEERRRAHDAIAARVGALEAALADRTQRLERVEERLDKMSTALLALQRKRPKQ